MLSRDSISCSSDSDTNVTMKDTVKKYQKRKICMHCKLNAICRNVNSDTDPVDNTQGI